jgi:hypothetical protein
VGVASIFGRHQQPFRQLKALVQVSSSRAESR